VKLVEQGQVHSVPYIPVSRCSLSLHPHFLQTAAVAAPQLSETPRSSRNLPILGHLESRLVEEKRTEEILETAKTFGKKEGGNLQTEKD
jgi:hypothetical protein